MKLFILLLGPLAFSAALNAQTPFFPQMNVETLKWNYLDISGKPVLDLPISGVEDLTPFSDGMAAAQDSATHLWGYINASGKWAIKPQYEQVQSFKNGYAIVSNECRSGCNQSQEGLLSTYISHIIDKKGKVIFTDNSQDEDPMKRFFLDENLGAELFRVVRGYGVNDMKSLINLKGEFLCDTYSVFSEKGNIVYDPQLDAFRCANVFYKRDGKVLLDLSAYSYVETFSDGYCWAYRDEGDDETSITWNVLLDQKGKEVLRLNGDVYKAPDPVEKGAFRYMDKDYQYFVFNIDTQTSDPYQPHEIESEMGISIGGKQPNGVRYIFSMEEGEPLIGFMNASGEVFYK